MERMKRTALALTMIGGLFLGGCASAATAQGMTVTPGEVSGAKSKDIGKDLAVDEVMGGSNTNWFDSSKIDNENFKGALVGSLRIAGMLKEGQGARYKMTATLLRLEQPIGGMDMTVISKIRYTVSDKKTGAVVLQEEITASYTAHLGDAFMGVTRNRLATEGSARKSIAQFIEKLGQGKLKAADVVAAK